MSLETVLVRDNAIIKKERDKRGADAGIQERVSNGSELCAEN